MAQEAAWVGDALASVREEQGALAADVQAASDDVAAVSALLSELHHAQLGLRHAADTLARQAGQQESWRLDQARARCAVVTALLRALLTLLRTQVRRGAATPGTPRDAPPPSIADQAALRELAGAQAALRRDLAAALHAVREQAAAHDRELRRTEQQSGARPLRLRTRMRRS